MTNLVFSFIKFFDDSTSDDDAANVYMEREWRVLGDVNFGLANVHRYSCLSVMKSVSEQTCQTTLDN